MKRKAQITIFMIVGLLILFVFLFTIQLTKDVRKGELQVEKEKVFSKTFNKEGLRIFVEDCLQDELENGLFLLGEQGRLWKDDPGGEKQFSESITGVTFFPNGKETRVSYGITKKQYNIKNAYPCKNDSSSPEFCRYEYPNTKVGFGNLDLRASTLKKDLQGFVVNRTDACVREFIQNNLSSAAVLEQTEVEIGLVIRNDGIAISADYPLKFSLGNEEFFHLSKFDFFYPTKFNQLLKAAVDLPLQFDQKYVDFNYTKETLVDASFTYGNDKMITNCAAFENYFLCNRTLFSDQYKALSIDLDKKELGNGDNVYTFKPAAGTVLSSSKDYVFRVARQNRPPALNYVERYSCPAYGYDYLVMENHDSELGIINITLSSIDPDEDDVEYSFFGDFGVNIGENMFVDNPGAGWYNVTGIAKDEHLLEDWQEIRVLVDRPLHSELYLHSPYILKTNSSSINYDDLFNSSSFAVSLEDPIFIEYIIPSNSSTPSTPDVIKINYTSPVENFGLGLPSGGVYNDQDCINLPGDTLSSATANCLLTDFTESQFVDWENEKSKMGIPGFTKLTDSGKLNITFEINYCGVVNQSTSSQIDIDVVECIPHYNPEHPFAYHPIGNYHKYTFGLTTSGETNFSYFKGYSDVKPFNASHSCCVGDALNPSSWSVAGITQKCFDNPLPGCYGGIVDHTALEKGYILETQVAYCDGKRGNACLGNPVTDYYGAVPTCGWNYQKVGMGSPFCSGVEDLCQGEQAFGFIAGVGWCSGKMGCGDICTSYVTYNGPETPPYFPSTKMAQLVKMNKFTHSSDLIDFGCGDCNNLPDNTACDLGFDGSFDDWCQGGDCVVKP